MLEVEDYRELISNCYLSDKLGLLDKLEKEKQKAEKIEELKEEIDAKYKQGYSYLDIAHKYNGQDIYKIFNDDLFLVFIGEIVIIFEHTTYRIKG